MNAKVGDKEHMLLVLNIERKGKYKYYRCLCDCGNETIIRSDSFGKTRSCGCLKKEKYFKLKDVTGQRFGRLVAIRRIEKPEGYKANDYPWECQCDCGNVVVAKLGSLSMGVTRSCGCSREESRVENIKKATASFSKKYLKENTSLSNMCVVHFKDNTSGAKGVVWDRRREKWIAQIGFKGRNIHLGRYDDFDTAVLARKEAEEKFFKPILEKYKEPTLKSDKKTGKFIANTKEELLHDLKRVAAPSDKILTRIYYNENGKYNSQTFVIRFGSWDTALKEAGLPRSRNYDREELIEILKELEKTLGRRPSTNDLKFPYPTFHVFQQEFQTFTNALVVAGLLEGSPIDDEALEKKKENLISKMNHIIANINRPARQVDFSNAILYSARNLFGSYKNAAIAAGFYEPTNKYTREEISEKLGKLTISKDRLPLKQEVTDCEGLPNPFTIPRYFGTETFVEALHLALYEYGPSQKYSRFYNEADLEDQLQTKMEELGRIPDWVDIGKDKSFPELAVMLDYLDSKSLKEFCKCILEKKLIACLKIILNQNSQKEG